MLLAWEGTADFSLMDRLQNYTNITLENVRTEAQRWPLQAIVIQWLINNDAPELSIERNPQAFCPLYFLQDQGNIYFHWDPTELYKNLQGTNILDRSQCEAFLNFRWTYGPDTVFRDIKMIPERARVIFTVSGSRFIKPPSIAAMQPHKLNQNTDPIKHLDHILTEAIAMWSPEKNDTYCEQSSGLDTTLISLLVGKVMQAAPRTVGYYPHDDQLEQILLRREEAIRLIGAIDICPSIEIYFENAFSLDFSQKHWPYEAPTSFEKNIVANAIALNGGDLVFSGIGGDELCQLSESEWLETKRSFNAPNEDFKYASTSVTHDDLEKDRLSEIPCWPTGFVPESSHDVANSIAAIYLRNNIWYAHPLALGHVQTFGHFLPLDWRKNRRLSREILKRMGLSDFFVQQVPKESVGLSIDKVLMDDAIFSRLFAQSILADEKMIDMDKLKKWRNALKQRPGYHHASGNILTAYALERSLKSISA